MGYERAVQNAWDNITKAGGLETSVRMLGVDYDINSMDRTVITSSSGASAKDHIKILLLHYLEKKLSGTLPATSGEWMDFREIAGATSYYSTFKKRTIDRIVTKFGDNPGKLFAAAKNLGAEKTSLGDMGLIVSPLEGVPISLTISRADDEFPPDGNILFDRSITKIFCTEDIVVLTETLVHTLS